MLVAILYYIEQNKLITLLLKVSVIDVLLKIYASNQIIAFGVRAEPQNRIESVTTLTGSISKRIRS